MPENVNVDSLECFRLFHGRGKLIPKWSQLSIDFFPPTMLLTIYEEVSEETLLQIRDVLNSIPHLKIQNILLQKRFIKGEQVILLKGETFEPSFAVENGKKYLLNLKQPQNIGFFLDMKNGREWIEKNSKDKSVLNLFSYTCSLSVVALLSGAKIVYNIDMSKSSLSVGEKESFE